jgi:MFS family permease
VLFVADGVTTALYGLLVWLALPETRPAGELHHDATRVSASTILRDRIFMTMCVLTFGEILFAPASMSLVADLAPAPLRGRYQGVFAIAFTSAFAAAPALGGYILTSAGARWLWIACLAMGCGMSAGFLVLRDAAPPQHVRWTSRDLS